MPTPNSILIRDERTRDGGSDALKAEIKDDGALLFEGYWSGPSVKATMGDSDYEYWITVPPEEKDGLLLQLLKDRFAQSVELKSWLEQRGIRFEFFSYT